MAIIPARLASERLPKKPLQLIQDKPLIVHVAEEVLKTGVFDKVYVATDSEEVMALFNDSAVEAIMTSATHESGTDRINEAANKIDEDFDTVFNIQGDEPFIYKDDIEALKAVLEDGALMASLYEPLKEDDLDDPNRVKVILNNDNEAIYFSRFGIPFSRQRDEVDSKFVGKHIGVYAYRKDFLKKFCEEPLGFHERNEKLEHLRALQIGSRIKMIHTKNAYQGVDTVDDLNRVNEILSNS